MIEFKRLPIGESLPIYDELAGLVPMASEDEQIALNEDINRNGLREPIVLWKGKIVDGRCRQKACLLMNKPIDYKELDDELSYDEVASFVKSVNTRRNLTITQKVISAVRKYIADKERGIKTEKQANIARQWGFSDRLFRNAKYIAEKRPEYIEPLFNGKSVKIENSKGLVISSTKITAIYAYIKKQEEMAIEIDIHAWDEDSAIKTIAGKEWYYAQLKNDNIKDTDILIKMKYAELANYKFHSSVDSTTGEVEDHTLE